MSVPGRLLGLAFQAYKALVSPVLHTIGPSQCKFLPTCSEYGYIAVARHGVLRGSALALARVARCHPWAGGGVDAVPDQESAGLRGCRHGSRSRTLS